MRSGVSARAAVTRAVAGPAARETHESCEHERAPEHQPTDALNDHRDLLPAGGHSL